MQKLVLTADLAAKLQTLHNQVELCDENGQTLGVFVPPEWHREMLSAWARSQFGDEEELRRARAEPGGLTTAEAIAFLNGLTGASGRVQ